MAEGCHGIKLFVASGSRPSAVEKIAGPSWQGTVCKGRGRNDAFPQDRATCQLKFLTTIIFSATNEEEKIIVRVECSPPALLQRSGKSISDWCRLELPGKS